jgi:hypothetical protein
MDKIKMEFTLMDAAEEVTTPSDKNFRVFKQADGLYRWVAISSSAFKDRDEEFVTEKSIQDDIDRCDKSGEYGPLRWWHMGGFEAPDGVDAWETWKAGPGIDIGTCDFNMLHGKMLIESGTFKTPEIGEAFATVKEPLEISLGFSHPINEPVGGVYNNIHRFERSLLPPGMASNLLTRFYAVTKGDSNMKAQAKLAVLVALLRNKPEVAAEILSDAEMVQKAAEAAGLEYKEVEEILQNDVQDEPVTEPVAVAPVETPVEAAPVEPVADGPETGGLKTEAPATEKAVPPPAPPEPEDIGDMTREELAAFVVDIINQVNGKSTAAASKKEADNEQALADALEMVKGLSTRVQAAEKSAIDLQQALQELTDARPVGIKQLSERRPTASADNLTATVPTGPHMDESFVNFLQGGK